MYLLRHIFLVFTGMSESSGPHTACKMSRNCWNSASAGKDIMGVQTKIMEPDTDSEGEVVYMY